MTLPSIFCTPIAVAAPSGARVMPAGVVTIPVKTSNAIKRRAERDLDYGEESKWSEQHGHFAFRAAGPYR